MTDSVKSPTGEKWLTRQRGGKAETIYSMIKPIAEKGQMTKTHVMYASNQSHVKLEGWLNKLEKANLITIKHLGRFVILIITPKGQELYALMRQINRYIEVFE